MADKLLHEINEATELIGLGRSKLYELLATGEIESVKVGKRRLIPHAALVEFVDRLRAHAAA
jgi:excisionase family DNA binding protein